MQRWWVLLACSASAVAIALAITALRPAPYVSSAFVAVPVGAAVDVGDRNAQAFAIAPLLASDPAVARAAGGQLQVRGTEDTTEIELRVHAGSAGAALKGAGAVARLVTDRGTAAAPAGTLVVVAAPAEATLDGTGSAEAAAVAALFGLVAGAIGVGWRHRALLVDPIPASNL